MSLCPALNVEETQWMMCSYLLPYLPTIFLALPLLKVLSAAHCFKLFFV